MPTLGRRTASQVVLSSGSSSSGPAPLSIDATQAWIGNDGQWSPVTLGVGTPAQYVQLLVSTTSTIPYAVLEDNKSCKDAKNTTTTCAISRGNLFDKNASSTWNTTGLYNLNYEQNLGIYATGIFAQDTVQLGLPGSKGGAITMPNQTAAAIVNSAYWVATWGIKPDYSNMTSLNNRIPSIIQNLKSAGTIPSLSWGYTAGAWYRTGTSKSAAVSLTFGGSDVSRYQQHNITFDMAADPSRDLVVGIRSITSDSTTEALLPSGIVSFLDAGVPHIWLPEEACAVFESAFNLTYNDTLGLYLVNDTAHDNLLQINPNITFTIGNDLSSAATVNITLPYSSFDLQLTADYPNVTEVTQYFPLRRAENATQYTLGRTFFQEAYVVADYEQRKFSVHQTLFPGVVNQSLVAIPPLPGTGPVTAPTPLSTGAAVGITVAAIALIFVLAAAIYRFRRNLNYLFHKVSPFHDDIPPPSTEKASELHGSSNAAEAPGSRPIPPEADSKEKSLELDSATKHELFNGGPNASELDSDSTRSSSSSARARAVGPDGVFELPGSESSTLADNSEYRLRDEHVNMTGAKTWLSDDYVNSDYTVSEAANSTTSTLSEREDHPNHQNEDVRCSQALSAPSASVYTRDSMVTMDSDCASTVQHEPQTYSPALFPEPTRPPTPEKQDTIDSTASTIPRFQSPVSYHHDNGEERCPQPSLLQRQNDSEHESSGPSSMSHSRNSQASERSIVSALSPRPSVYHQGPGLNGLLRIGVAEGYPIRKDSIVSPL